ncbi:hypothetical protein DORI_91 [Mycobacterium phage Dori]|uniref:hypothetical protein n=1 Tax=Mycobacterium phage Dori TaxID=1089121 RepID=UPI000232F591|nr:hypothetical protein DORI_91 [Mycobacterium phage Dori]AER47740.1 hypothetical protein DORI_91 [Mycobacterium phage Dori]
MTEPKTIRRYTTRALLDVGPQPGMVIRASDDDAAPWKLVDTLHDEWFWDTTPGQDPVRVDGVSVEFTDGTTRFLGGDANEVEVGFSEPE